MCAVTTQAKTKGKRKRSSGLYWQDGVGGGEQKKGKSCLLREFSGIIGVNIVIEEL